jgi:hypothetical protein
VPELDDLAAAPTGPDPAAPTPGLAWHPLLVAVVPLVTAVGACLADAGGRVLVGTPEAGATEVPLLFDGVLVGRVHLPPPPPVPPLHGALDHLLRELATAHGGPLDELGRTAKQQVVADLDARGAFVLRKAVEDVADALGVSRFTVYNYLARAQDGESAT